MPARGFWALLAMMAACVPALVHAAPTTIRFGVTGDYPPFAERQADGSLAGADIVIARQIAQEMGAQVVFVPTTWQTLGADFAAGRFDIAIGGLTVTPERAALGTFSMALMDDGKRPLARCADRRRYRTLADIDRIGVRVQINRGPAIAVLAKEWFHQATVTVNPDDATLTGALLQGRSDVWITDGVVVDHLARRFSGRLCATTHRPFNHVAKAWLMRSDAVLVARINAGLQRALAGGAWLKALRAVP